MVRTPTRQFFKRARLRKILARSRNREDSSGQPFVSEPFHFRPTPLWKRSFDIVFACLLLVILAPILATIAAWVKISSPGPVLFSQRRVGAMGREFTIWKFRTMHVRSSDSSHRDYVKRLVSSNKQMTKCNHDSRLIKFAPILRLTGADELPQLLNILVGDMSVVGPRPDVLAVADYTTEQLRRFDVRPGLTGLWQVSGKNSTTFDEMIQMDLEYVRRRSPWLDLKIILKTIPAVLTQLRSQLPS